MRPLPNVLALLALALLAAPGEAHHSWARYDGENVVTTAGVLTKIDWASPHVVMYFAVADEAGASTDWTVEMDPPTLLNRYGLRHDVLTPGMKITITGVPARSGAPMMRAVTITTEDGTVYRVSSRVSSWAALLRRSWSVALLVACGARAPAPPPANFPGTPPPSPPAVIQSLSAEPATLEPGASTTLRWEALNAYSLAVEPDVGTVATRGSVSVAPPATTTYVLTATGSGGSVSRSVTVTVAGTAPRAATATSSERASQVPRLADGKPDLSGLYAAEGKVRLAGTVALKPGAEGFRVPPAADDLGSGVSCLPPGVPAATMLPFPLEIVHTPGKLVIVYEAYHQFRVIPIGRAHADYLAPAYMGHSVARWDGDTLVVDVRGFNDKTLVAGHRHTDELRVTERYRRTSFDTIAYEALVEDPNVFAAPVRFAGTLTLHPEWEIGEYVCTENDQNYDALFGTDAN